MKGLGTNTTGVTLVTASGTDICESVTIPSYGVLRCKTKAASVASTSLKVKLGTTSSACVGTSGECDYETSSVNFPEVSAIALTDAHTLSFTGTGLQLLQADYTAGVTFSGIKADSVTLDSDTSATAVFTQGIPIGSGVKPKLYFANAATGITHWAVSTATVSNTLTPSLSLDSSLDCSFAGGCLLKVTQPGLVHNLLNDTAKNVIRVCGQVCNATAVNQTGAESV